MHPYYPTQITHDIMGRLESLILRCIVSSIYLVRLVEIGRAHV